MIYNRRDGTPTIQYASIELIKYLKESERCLNSFKSMKTNFFNMHKIQIFRFTGSDVMTFIEFFNCNLTSALSSQNTCSFVSPCCLFRFHSLLRDDLSQRGLNAQNSFSETNYFPETSQKTDELNIVFQ